MELLKSKISKNISVQDNIDKFKKIGGNENVAILIYNFKYNIKSLTSVGEEKKAKYLKKMPTKKRLQILDIKIIEKTANQSLNLNKRIL